MTSLQAPQEINSVQFVEPIELKYPQPRITRRRQLGLANQRRREDERKRKKITEFGEVQTEITQQMNWGIRHPEAFLIDAITIDVTGEVDRKATSFSTLKVGFELEVDTRSFGFKKSNVHIGFKLTKDGIYEYQSVQKQITDLKPMQKTWVTAEFPVNGIPLLGGKIHFQLMDITAVVPKGGLKLSKAKVEQVGFTN